MPPRNETISGWMEDEALLARGDLHRLSVRCPSTAIDKCQKQRKRTVDKMAQDWKNHNWEMKGFIRFTFGIRTLDTFTVKPDGCPNPEFSQPSGQFPKSEATTIDRRLFAQTKKLREFSLETGVYRSINTFGGNAARRALRTAMTSITSWPIAPLTGLR